MNPTITAIEAQEILDSRGNPTVQAKVTTDASSAIAAVPSGASTGSHEAKELRDNDPTHAGGLGVLKALDNIQSIIAPALIGMDASAQADIDNKLISLDGTADKSHLGANAMLAVSIACAKVAANSKNTPVFEHLRTLATIPTSRTVPLLYMNLINGGLHAKSRLAFQEYHVVPQTDDVHEALHMGATIENTIRETIRKSYGSASANFGDEGGCAPDITDPLVPLQILWEAIEQHGWTDKIKLAMDVAASSFYADEKYSIAENTLSTDELFDWYQKAAAQFPIVSIEDPFQEEAFEDFARLNTQLMVIGDDLTTTNPERLKEAVEHRAISGIIIKPNQIGTLTETLQTMRLARENDIHCIVSHRSGETNDDFIADLAYAFGTFGLKSGAPRSGERMAKYNRLLNIISK